jgi:tetratricopeptide (TPR) repeat protein
VSSDSDNTPVAEILKQGNESFALGKWDEAILAYRKAMTKDPNCLLACQKLAKAFAIRGQMKNTLEALYHVMDLFEAEDQLSEVVKTAEEIQLLYPDNDQARLKVIIAHHIQGNIPDAIRESRELAKIYQEQGRGEEALNLLQRAKSLDPKNIDISLEYAEAHISYGHLKEGASSLFATAELCLQVDRENPQPEPDIQPAQAVEPDEVDVEFAPKPKVSLKRRAVDCLRRLKLLTPTDISILLKIGDILIEMEQVDEAEQELRAALRLDLSNARALLNLGRVCLKKGQFRDAQLVLSRLIQSDPSQIEARLQLAELYRQQGQINEAASTLENLAKWCLENRDKDRAREYYLKVLEIAPDSSVAKHHLSVLGHANAG